MTKSYEYVGVFPLFFLVLVCFDVVKMHYSETEIKPYVNMGSYILAFSLGAGPVPALLLPEIFASRIRAKAVSLSMGMHWVSHFVFH